jgi:hypothetical protein
MMHTQKVVGETKQQGVKKMMVSSVTVELNRVRRNSKNAAYAVATEKETVYYETIREAVYHAVTKKDCDIILLGSNKLIAFWCSYSKSMRFGFGATEWDKSAMCRDLWWADWNQTKLV